MPMPQHQPSPETPTNEPGWLPRDAVTIGILAALPHEGAAMECLIEDVRLDQPDDDPNNYRIGKLPSSDPDRPHLVALAMLPRDGTRHAAVLCTNLLRTFPSVQCVIMTGISGGIPRSGQPDRHVRLGDVVVATEGIVDYGHVRQVDGVRQLRRNEGLVSVPLLRAAGELRLRESAGHRPWERWLDPEQTAQARDYPRPPEETDVLLVHGNRVPHPDRAASGHPPGRPKVHYGAVGSADVLMRDEEARDELARDFGSLVAMEMEGSGIAASTAAHAVHWFMVRGVADYAEQAGKNDVWHRHASYVAAAYIRALLAACRPLSAPPGDRALTLVPGDVHEQLRALFRRLPPLDMREPWGAVAADLAHPPPVEMTTPERAFQYLSNLNSDPDGLPPSLAFVDAVADQLAEDPALAAELRRWVDQQARRMCVTSLLTQRRGRPKRVPDGSDAKPCLLIEITIDGIDRRYCRITHWIQERSGPWRPRPGDPRDNVPLDAAEQVVEHLVDHAEQTWPASADEVAIEFLLPIGLLNLPVEWWRTHATSIQPPPLCVDYTVVVRSLDRMRHGSRPRMWGKRWQALSTEPFTRHVHWGVGARTDDDLVAWDVRLRADESLASVVLSGPPEERPGREELDMALRAGVPVILWDRRPHRPTESTAAIEGLVNGDPADLPARTRNLRATAAAAPSADRSGHPGNFVALLWDNPHRVVAPRRAAE